MTNSRKKIKELDLIELNKYLDEEMAKDIKNLEFITMLRLRKHIIMLRDIVNDIYWDDKGEGLFGKKTPDTISQARDILNDPDTNDQGKIDLFFKLVDQKYPEIAGKIIVDDTNKSKLDKTVPPLDRFKYVAHELSLLFEKSPIKIENYPESYSTYKYLVDDIGTDISVKEEHKKNLKSVGSGIVKMQRIIDKDVGKKTIREDAHWRKHMSENLHLIKELAEDKYWSNKGNENTSTSKKVDFTPKFILEYRKVLADNTITLNDKIQAIQKISKEACEKFKSGNTDLYNFAFNVEKLLSTNDVSYEKPLKNQKTEMESRNKYFNKNHVDGIYQKMKNELVDDKKWETKGKGFFGGAILPDGISRAREILKKADAAIEKVPSNILDAHLAKERIQRLAVEAVLMLMKLKHNEYQAREKSWNWNPIDLDLKMIYKKYADISNDWYSMHPEQKDKLNKLTSATRLSSINSD